MPTPPFLLIFLRLLANPPSPSNSHGLHPIPLKSGTVSIANAYDSKQRSAPAGARYDRKDWTMIGRLQQFSLGLGTASHRIVLSTVLSQSRRSSVMTNPYRPPEIPPDADLPEAPHPV